jgi:T-complex protein 1 subunit beta
MSGEHGRESVMVTNDGATILKAVGVDNPASKVLVGKMLWMCVFAHCADMALAQDADVGDGTTSVTVLAAELLREAEKLVDQKLHPQTIVAGYRRATDVSLTALEHMASVTK